MEGVEHLEGRSGVMPGGEEGGGGGDHGEAEDAAEEGEGEGEGEIVLYLRKNKMFIVNETTKKKIWENF